MPESPQLYEQGTYDPARTRADRVLELVRKLVDRDRLRLIGPLPPAASVVEVGSGDGRFLEALVRAGHSSTGIEPSRPYVRRARRRGVTVLATTAERAELAEATQDAVLMWHVLEHVADPVEALRRARRWLKGDGKLVLAVPNLESLQARIGGDRWFHQEVPRHVTHFTRAGLVSLLGRSGFEVRRIRRLALEYNVFGMWQTLVNRLAAEPNVLFRFVKRTLRYDRRLDALRDVAVVVVAGLPLVPVAVALELGASVRGKGGTLVLEAAPR